MPDKTPPAAIANLGDLSTRLADDLLTLDKELGDGAELHVVADISAPEPPETLETPQD